MEEVVSLIRSAEEAADWEKLYHRLCRDDACEIMQRSKTYIPAAMEQLDPATHTVGCIMLLEAMARACENEEEIQWLVPRVKDTLLSANTAQAIIARKHSGAFRTNRVGMLARPLRRAVHLLQDHPSQLTVAHTLLLKVLLKLQLYERGKSVLSRPVVEVSPDVPPTAEDVLLFLNYGARIYIGLEQWRDALDFTKMCIDVPGMLLSAIQVDSYKKYMLVSLLHQGPPVRDPVPGMSKLAVSLRNEAAPYLSLANAFEGASLEELNRVVTQHRELWERDGHTGLVSRVVSAWRQWQIQLLTKSFATRSLADVAAAAQLPSPDHAEVELLGMIAQGKIRATVDASHGMVSFEEHPPTYDDAATLDAVNSRLQTLADLRDRIVGVQTRLATDSRVARAAVSTSGSAMAAPSFMASFGMYEGGEVDMEP